MERAVTRQIVHIDENLCNGCAICVSPCVEGAIEIVDGKARVLREELCDGAGACLGACPTGALTVEVREAMPFEPAAAEGDVSEASDACNTEVCFFCGATDEQVALVRIRTKGRDAWCCAACLPKLIHG